MDFLLKFVIGMAVLATIAAVNEGDGDLVKMFAKERKEMREEQKEMRADFRRENDELHQGLAEQKKENAAQKEEIQKLHKRLHQADLKNKEAHRQRDEKQSQELEVKISSAIRQERHSSELEDVVESVVKRSIRHSGKNNTNNSLEIELKKLIDHQIDHYLIEQRICVGGIFGQSAGVHTQTVNFGYEFPRTPTFSASLANVHNQVTSSLYMKVGVTSVTRSSAKIESKALWASTAALRVSWLACL